MNIPSEVKIGAHTYKVIREDYDGDNDARFGHCYPRKLTIFIDDRASQSQQEETFFHEVLHAICDQIRAFPKDDGELEERVVQGLAHGIYQVIKENNLVLE